MLDWDGIFSRWVTGSTCREKGSQRTKGPRRKKNKEKKIHPLSETLEIFQPNSHVPSSKETEGFTEGEGVNNNDQRLGLQNGI